MDTPRPFRRTSVSDSRIIPVPEKQLLIKIEAVPISVGEINLNLLSHFYSLHICFIPNEQNDISAVGSETLQLLSLPMEPFSKRTPSFSPPSTYDEDIRDSETVWEHENSVSERQRSYSNWD